MVIRSVRSGGASAQAKRPNYKRARAVLGADFLTPEEVIATRGIFYDNEQLKALDDGFPTDEEIVRLQETECLLMPNPSCPLALVLVRALNTELFFMRDDAGWNMEKARNPFVVNDKTEVATWLAIRKDVVPGSTNLGLEDQLGCLSGVERVPNAAEVAWALTTYREARGVYLMCTTYGRTSSVDAHGQHTIGGNFDGKGLRFCNWSDKERNQHLGVFAAMMLPVRA